MKKRVLITIVTILMFLIGITGCFEEKIDSNNNQDQDINQNGNISSFNVSLLEISYDVDGDGQQALFWNVDSNISVTFTVSYNKQEIDTGFLKIENISTVNLSNQKSYNKTWSNDSIILNLEKGEKSIQDLTGNYLDFGKNEQRITYYYKSNETKNNWIQFGYICLKVPQVNITPSKIPIGVSSTIQVNTLGRNNQSIGNVYVRLHGQGLDVNGTTDAQTGIIEFTISPQSTGLINIDIGVQGKTLEKKYIEVL